LPRKKESLPRTCSVCKGTFYKPASHLAKWPALTCSRACAAVLRVKAVDRTCVVCSKPFKIQPCKLKKGVGLYCSNECNGKADQNRTTVACAFCKSEFGVPQHKVRTRKLHFCSIECKFGVLKRYGINRDAEKFRGARNAHLLASCCARCGSVSRLELDHIKPRFAGGTATPDNVQTLCKRCNLKKFWYEDLPFYLGSSGQHDQ